MDRPGGGGNGIDSVCRLVDAQASDGVLFAKVVAKHKEMRFAYCERQRGAAKVAANVARHIERDVIDKPREWRPLVYCWRGGQRSGSFASILSQIGWRVEIIEGGYKSWRHLVVDALYDAPFPCPVVVLDGNTGSAKTEVLNLLPERGVQVLDLEGMANHRGSLFGHMGDQPSQKAFEGRLAVALARQGRRVGLLDADIYGPSQPRMMSVNRRPASPDGKTIEPIVAHGVTMMSIGLMLKEDEAVIWRGPMIMGALQQLLTQVDWGKLDVLIVDLPPGTGDIQLTLCQRTQLTGALVVSTPQDVALLDARKALDMFQKLKTPVLGLIENMSTYVCPNCGHEAHIFGHGGVAAEAEKLGLPFLGELPLALEVRMAGDAGKPIAAGEGPAANVRPPHW